MRNRWIALAGRIGSVLLVIGAVLALVSVTPPAPTGYASSTGTNLGPGKYYANPFTRVYSPASGLRITTSSNDSLRLYLVEVEYQDFQLWVSTWVDTWFEHNLPDVDEDRRVISTYNVSVLEAYLQAHPGGILMDREISGEDTFDHFPASPTNITVIFSNPSKGWIDLDLRMSGVSGLVPRERVIVPRAALLILGFVLLVPRIIEHFG